MSTEAADVTATLNGVEDRKCIKSKSKLKLVQMKVVAPENVGDIEECVNLSNGDKYVIDSQVTQLKLGFNWTASDVDVDASLAIYDKDMKCIDVNWWDKKVSKYCGICHLRDDRTGEPDADTSLNETILIELYWMPKAVHYIVPVVTVYSKGKTLKDISDLAMSLIYAEPQTLTGDTSKEFETAICKFAPDEKLELSSIVMGNFTRSGAWWSYNAYTKIMRGRTVKEIVHNLNVAALIKEPAESADRYRIFVTVLEGKGLAIADYEGFKPTSSDCYVEIKYKQKRICSEVIEQTTDPKWSMEKRELDVVTISSHDIVDISVWDHDKETPDEFLGSVSVALGGIAKLGNGEHVVELTLGPSRDEEIVPTTGIEISGSIVVKFEALKVDYNLD